MSTEIFAHRYENGLVLVAQSMPWLESAAFTMMVPAGCAWEPDGLAGLASFTCEMVSRGCGDRDHRQFMNDLDDLGVERGEGVSDSSTTFSGATLADRLPQVLQIYADVLRRPRLAPEQLEPSRNVLLQELQALEDELQHKLMERLRELHYPFPHGRSSHGDAAGLKATTPADIQQFLQTFYRPNGSILGVAGRFDWPALRDQIGNLFGDWGRQVEVPLQHRPAVGSRLHIPHDSNQTHIGVAYESIPVSHPDYFLAGAAVSVLSGGMSARLFTEVREKRGLCYSVYASHHSLKDIASVSCYAGSRPERAQETLDVILQELTGLKNGVSQTELDRVKAQYKSSVVMQQESSYSRSSAIVRDWFHLGRVRTLEEINLLIDTLSVDRMNTFLAAHAPREFTVASLGPKPLEVTVGVS